MDYQNIPNGRHAAFLKKFKARYTDLIATIPAE
jgi:hypothetical protein